MTVQDIYRILDEAAPFASQESYDNSGLLVGSGDQEVHKVLLTLDITVPVIEEATACGADLILSHHPVIWSPLKSLSPQNPVWLLARNNIAAICSHTCMDIAAEGLNALYGRKLNAALGFDGASEPLELLSGNRVLGACANLQTEIDADTLAQKLGYTFNRHTLRYCDGGKPIRKVAWCTGSGGDLIETAIERGADALITGDCKHSIWVLAQNLGFTLFDCGHFETEVIVTQCFQELLAPYADSFELVISKVGTTPLFNTI